MKESPPYFLQLPGSGASLGWPYLPEQQRLGADLPYTGMVATIHLPDKHIHPANKIDVGERLATWALNGEYRKNIPASGPLLERVEFADGKATVRLAHAESGLMAAIQNG